MTEINEKQKYPGNKRGYDKNYLRVHGLKCPRCFGTGLTDDAGDDWPLLQCPPCKDCNGSGYVPKSKKENKND